MLSKIAAALIAVWLILLLMGKGGFVHLLLLNAAGLLIVDLTARYRSSLRETDEPTEPERHQMRITE